MDIWECSLDEAVAEAPQSFRAMHTMAQAMQQRHREIDRCRTERQWLSGLKSHVYHTHIAISGQHEGALTRLAELFYHTASQPALPWYPAFLGGQSKAVSIAPGDGVEQHQLCWATFDLGLGQPRYYRQLVSLGYPDAATAVVVVGMCSRLRFSMCVVFSAIAIVCLAFYFWGCLDLLYLLVGV